MVGLLTLGPMVIRSAGANALFIERGLALGHSREALLAAQHNIQDWLRILTPLLYGRLYNSYRGNVYYVSAGMLILAELLFLTLKEKSISTKSAASE